MTTRDLPSGSLDLPMTVGVKMAGGQNMNRIVDRSPRRSRHEGSRVVLDGTYGKPGHRRVVVRGRGQGRTGVELQTNTSGGRGIDERFLFFLRCAAQSRGPLLPELRRATGLPRTVQLALASEPHTAERAG
jgi:hypothetical protein